MSDKYYDKLWEMWCECEDPKKKAQYMWELVVAEEINLPGGNPKTFDECYEYSQRKLREQSNEKSRKELEDFLKCAYIRANKAIDIIVELRGRGADSQNSEIRETVGHLIMAMKDIEKAEYELA